MFTTKSIQMIWNAPINRSLGRFSVSLFNLASFPQPRRFLHVKHEATTPSPDDLLAKHYHALYPGLKREFFDFLKDVSQMEKEILPVTRIIMEHQSKFESSTVVFTKHELFAHLCSRGYTIQLANMLTKDMDEAMIPRWTLSQWTVAFLSYATKSWASAAAGDTSKKAMQTRTSRTIPISDLGVEFDKLKMKSSHKILLHFTRKQHAESIQKTGIRLSRCHDFSEFAVNGAFYLVDSVEFGLKWLRSRHPSQQGTVLVFQVPDVYFRRHRIGHLESGNDDWKKFCYANFNEDQERKQETRFVIDNDIIVGPICKFRVTSPRHMDHSTMEPLLDSNQNICMQHAIVKQHAADQLMKYQTKTWFIVRDNMICPF